MTELASGWQEHLHAEFESPSLAALRSFILFEERAGRSIFPPAGDRLRALELVPLESVRVVILGQDPYHGAGQAHGLCFSVRPGVKTPPSLANIFKELEGDLGVPPARHGFLEHWARQGVLLLNSVLTVREGAAGSHQGQGWEHFTDAVVRLVNARPEPIVFMLWGAYAQKKAAFVDPSRHLVLKAPHPSPLSAYSGFFGCKHFSKANDFLLSRGLAPIDWALPEQV